MSAVPVVALRGASLRYGENAGWSELNLTIAEGQRLGIVGNVGCGKTTLLEALVGLRPLQSGRLEHNGEAVTDDKGLAALRRDVGLVFQNPDEQLFMPTVLEDVAFGPLNLDMGTHEAEGIARETLTRLGVLHLAERLIHTLSGGQKRLVALAGVLAMGPRVILLDEPTNDLDPASREAVLSLVAHLDCAMVVVSHDLQVVARLCGAQAGGTTLRLCGGSLAHMVE